jgi:pimeloyl-ACP methyl ester carboxylesterase
VEFFETSDGVRLAYELEGSGPPLLLHLGAGCDSGLWRAAGYVEPLARSYTCVLFDHRGHGESDKPRGPAAYHLDRLTADVVELLDRLGLASVAFWAYSAGMYPGIRLAQLQPERVSALVLSGTASPPGPPEGRYDWLDATVAGYRAHGWEKLIENFDNEETTPVPEWMKERIRATDVEQFVDLMSAFPSWQWEEWDALVDLPTPTLFLTGELEDPDDDVGTLVARMPRGERLRLQGLGHINAFLATEQVLPRVEAFLAEHAPQASSPS